MDYAYTSTFYFQVNDFEYWVKHLVRYGTSEHILNVTKAEIASKGDGITVCNQGFKDLATLKEMRAAIINKIKEGVL